MYYKAVFVLGLASAISAKSVPKREASTSAASSSLPSSLYYPPFGWVNSGCYTDSSARTLSDPANLSGPVTRDSCVTACHDAGYIYAGVENGTECFCSNTFTASGVKTSDDDCSTPCAGDATQTCGAGWRIEVFQDPAKGKLNWPPAGWSSLGCYTDSLNRTLNEEFWSNNGIVSSTDCIFNCLLTGFKYAGLEAGNQCYCANSIASTGVPAPGGECSSHCASNPANTSGCGGEWRLSMFRNDVWEQKPTPTTTASVPQQTVYTPPAGWSSLGCYTDASTRTLPNDIFITDRISSPTDCITHCKGNSFKYAGLEAGNECYCANSISSISTKVADEECSTPCAANSANTCGGGWRLSIYGPTAA